MSLTVIEDRFFVTLLTGPLKPASNKKACFDLGCFVIVIEICCFVILSFCRFFPFHSLKNYNRFNCVLKNGQEKMDTNCSHKKLGLCSLAQI